LEFYFVVGANALTDSVEVLSLYAWEAFFLVQLIVFNAHANSQIVPLLVQQA
jgi:hypothetical protein